MLVLDFFSLKHFSSQKIKINQANITKCVLHSSLLLKIKIIVTMA